MNKKKLNEMAVAQSFTDFMKINKSLQDRNRPTYEMYLERGKNFLSDKRGRDFANWIEDLTLQNIESDYEIVALMMAIQLNLMYL